MRPIVHIAGARLLLLFNFVGVVAILVFSSSCRHADDPPSLDAIKRRVREKYPQLSHVSPEQVASWTDETTSDPPILLDTREQAEFAVSHLREAKRVDPAADVEQLERSVLNGVAKDRRIVVYCAVGVRSAAVAERLRRAGFENVHNLNGSIFQWANEGRPVYRDGKKVTKVHPYDERWGRLLKKEYRADIDE